MTSWPRAARTVALLAGLAVSGTAAGACLVLTAHPDGTPLAELPLAAPAFTVTYVHSVTRTPVIERYRVDGDTLVQTEIRFAQHGPGLPTEPDPGGSLQLRDGWMVMTMARPHAEIVMRVHRDQRPQLVAGETTVPLSAWGNRAVALRATTGSCAAH